MASEGSSNTGVTLVSAVFAALGGGFVAAIVVALLFFAFGAFDAEADVGPKITAQEGLVSADFAKEAAAIAGPSVVSIISGSELVDPNTGYATSSPYATGSGVIISEDGYIVTNNHVVTGDDLTTPVDEVLVQLGPEYVPARIVGRDAMNDIAVIKIDRDGLDPIEIGSSGDLEPGDPIVVIGNPSGIGISVSTGIISAVGRTFGWELFTREQTGSEELGQLSAAIQVDAAVNHGNSGGALINYKGEYIGIPSAGLGDFGPQGLNFCIPIDVADGIIEDLIQYGRAFHPYFGANTITVDLVAADLYSLPTETGAFIDEVEEGSPAEEAGLAPGDIIVKFDGETIDTQLDLAGTVRAREIGETVSLEVWRMDPDTEEWDLYDAEVTLGETEAAR